MNLHDTGHKADETACIDKINAVLYYHTIRVLSRYFLNIFTLSASPTLSDHQF